MEEKYLKIIALLKSNDFWYGTISTVLVVLIVFLLTKYVVVKHHPKYKKLENDDLKFKEFLKQFAKNNEVKKSTVADFFRINKKQLEEEFSKEKDNIISSENIEKIIEEAVQEYQQSE